MRYLILGILLSLIGVLISIVVWGNEKAYLISGIIGMIFISISIVLSGSIISGDRMRANFATESFEDKQNRNSITLRSALIGIPNLVISFLGYMFL